MMVSDYPTNGASDKRFLEGSPLRDRFRLKRKLYGPSDQYALDIDLVGIIKPFGPGFWLDVKRLDEEITYSEGDCYNHLLLLAPVYIIRTSDPDWGPFYISEYCGGNWLPDPPEVDEHPVALCRNWPELAEWEQILREQRRRAMEEEAVEGIIPACRHCRFCPGQGSPSVLGEPEPSGSGDAGP